MLVESRKFQGRNLHFKKTTIEDFVGSDSGFDLIFSNAALQWSDNHHKLFPGLIEKLNSGGQFAVQMPFQKENILNVLLLELVREKPFVEILNGFCRSSPVLTVDEYAKILFDNGLSNLKLFLKVYPIIADSEIDLYNFIKGSSLIPYLERMDTNEQEIFRTEYLKRIRHYFGSFPSIYSFKRILMYGSKP